MVAILHRYWPYVVGDDRICIRASAAQHRRWISSYGLWMANMRSNCLIFALWRTLRRGGVLILQRSHAGPYLHSMWTEKLPEDLPVEHFSPEDKSEGLHLEPLFIGDVAYHVGKSHANPPKSNGWIDPVFLFFWIIQLLGWVAFIAILSWPIFSYAGDARVCEVRQQQILETK
jgi:hypothetical protein